MRGIGPDGCCWRFAIWGIRPKSKAILNWKVLK